MRTLNQSGYFDQSKRPRLFVQVTEPDGTVILSQGTAEVGTIEDRISSFKSISEEIDPAGGMATVSSAGVSRLVLDERLPLCTEASLEFAAQSGYAGGGRLICTGAAGASYASVRNALACTDFGTPSIAVGRGYNAGNDWFQVMRGFLQIRVPAMTTLEDAYLALPGVIKDAGVAFTIYGVLGNWSNINTGNGLFNDFAGWGVSGNYSVAVLTEPWSSDEYGAMNYIRFNEAGRAAMLAASGGIFRLMLLSYSDIYYTGFSDPVGSETVTFDRASARLCLRYNSKTLENKKFQVLYGFDPVTTVSDTALDVIWTGVVDSWERDAQTLTINGRTNDLKENPKISKTVISRAGIYYLSDEAIIGKPVPVIYGDFMTAIEHRGGLPSFLNGVDSDNRYGNGDFVKGYIYDNDMPSSIKMIIAGHDIKASDFYPAIWNSEKESFVALAGDASDILDGSDKSGKISVASGGLVNFPYNYIAPGSSASIQPILGEVPSLLQNFYAVDPENAVNEIYDDWTEIPIGTSVTAVEYQVRVPYAGTMYDDIAIVIETLAPSGYETNKIMLCAYTYEDNGDSNLHTSYLNSDGQHIHNIDIEYLPSRDKTMTIWLAVNGAATTKTVKFRNLCVIRGMNQDITTEAYIKAQGMLDDASGTVTGTPSALVENPSHVIEAFVRNEMGIAGTDIVTAAFDTAATDTAGCTFAFQLLKQEQARNLLDEMGRQGRMFLRWDHNDHLTAKMFDASDAFPASTNDIPGDHDIFTRTGDPVSGVCTHHQILPGGVKMQPHDTYYNDFVIKYRQNYATDDFAGVLTVNKDGENLNDAYLSGTTGADLVTMCSDLYDRVGSVKTLTIEAWAIRDEATATLLAQHLVEWYARVRNVIEFPTDISAIMTEPGDFINVRDDYVIDPLYGTATMNVKKWMAMKKVYDLNNNSITITAIEV